MNWLGKIILGLCLIFIFLGIFNSLIDIKDKTRPASDYYIEHAIKEIGAINVVSSIYLGYRVYDTIGESIVLLLAVVGIIVLIRYNEKRI